MNNKCLIPILLLVLSAFATPVQATLIQHSFSGAMERVANSPVSGQSFLGTMTWVAPQADREIHPQWGWYSASFEISFPGLGGANRVFSGRAKLDLTNNLPPYFDQLKIFTSRTPGTPYPVETNPFPGLNWLSLVLQDTSNAAFSCDELLTTLPTLSTFSKRSVTLAFQNVTNHGTITALTLVPVPEPSALALMLLGLVALAWQLRVTPSPRFR